ncbi:hypothetical protein K504DRAFT_465139 [Pleomassaria siparia CBS 279.74]|uniref:F-box domain-containing protein n=1 Tax=Pleomassaria siparia CBS 279.74 TaxID=1314801 RepID=A0A6G1KFX0_9PLEO|nr:hypothetical protein K504DRAFT_465139 [Pleomassaria siparia CBS 279.74]
MENTVAAIVDPLLFPGVFDDSDVLRPATKPTLPAHATLESLSEELLLNIIEHTDCSLSLARLSLVNRQLCRLATSYLYANFDTRLHNPYLFIRTLLTVPKLASFVSTLTWGLDVDIKESYTQPLRVFSPPARRPRICPHSFTIVNGVSFSKPIADRDLIVSKLEELAIPHAKQIAWRFDLDDSCLYLDELFLQTILLVVPNLVKLETGKVCPSSTLYQTHDTLRPGFVHSFSHLRVAIISDRRDVDLYPLFSLPSIHTIELGGVTRIGRYTFRLPPRISNIKVLKIVNSHARIDVIATYISACRSLRTFLYGHSTSLWQELFGTRPVFVSSPIIHLPELNVTPLTAALSSHRDTLCNLSIVNNAEDNKPRAVVTGSLGSLVDFKALRNICLPLEGFSVLSLPDDTIQRYTLSLPSNVESLFLSFSFRFTSTEKCIISACDRIINAFIDHRPELTKLSLLLETKECMSDACWETWERDEPERTVAVKRINVVPDRGLGRCTRMTQYTHLPIGIPINTTV